MLIFDENLKTIMIDNPTYPILTNYFYVLDLKMMDYTLTPLFATETVTSPIITLEVNNFRFKISSTWYLLVYEEDTVQLDVLHIGKELLGKEFTAMIFGPNMKSSRPGIIKAVDYEVSGTVVSPLLKKHQMLCHPISEDCWINVTPSDLYNKYLKNKLVGDIIY